MRAQAADLQRLDRLLEVVLRPGRAGQMHDRADVDREPRCSWLTLWVHERERPVGPKRWAMLLDLPSARLSRRDDLVAAVEQGLAEV